MAYKITTHEAGYQGIAITDTVQNHALGTLVWAEDPTYGGGQFVYLKGVASTAVGDVVTIATGHTTVRGVAAGRGRVAVAMSANVANQYGWYQVAGEAVVNAANTVVASTPAYLTATAGSVDDAVVVGDKIDGFVFSAARTGAGTVTAMLSSPCANGNG